MLTKLHEDEEKALLKVAEIRVISKYTIYFIASHYAHLLWPYYNTAT